MVFQDFTKTYFLYIKKIKSDGTVLAQQIVPISYGPKQKWLARLNEESSLSDNNRSAISLPRLAFEITGFQYDADRQQNKLIKTSKGGLNADKSNRGFQNLSCNASLNHKGYGRQTHILF